MLELYDHELNEMGNMLEVMIRMYNACGLPESRIEKERYVAIGKMRIWIN